MKEKQEVLRQVCYVCGKPITECREAQPRKLFLAREDAKLYHITSPVYIGDDTYRHLRCAPGSSRWMDSKVGKKSKLRMYFKLAKQEKGAYSGDSSER